MPTPTPDLPRVSLLPLVLGTCLATQVAHAGGPDEAAAPYGVRADPRPVPGELLTTPLPEPLQLGPAKSNVFFLNYDGVTIKFTGQEDDSSQNISQFQDFAMNYQPYGGGAKRAASMQAVKSDWAKYKVTITDQRPGGGNYTMCVNSPTNPFGGGVLGIAPLDCNDGQARNIVFAYHSDNDQFPAATQATTMSQEIAHAYGLEHVMEPNDIMNPYNAGGDPSFIDQCFTLDGGGQGIACGQQHAQFCGGNGQNSHQELVALFGVSEPDPVPPVVNIVQPGNGQVLDAPANFPIVVEASDNVGVKQVQLFNNGAPLASWNSPPYATDAQNAAVGQYCLTATAIDEAGNKGESAQVCVTVQEKMDPPDPTTDPTTDPTADPTADPGTGTGGDGGSGSDDTSGGEGDGSGGLEDSGDAAPEAPGFVDPALPPGYGQNSEGGCTVEPAPVPTASLLVLVLGLFTRRRRAA